jgi:GNAT superfamily N-acetyltransferase
MPQYRIEPLSTATWPAFHALVDKHNGIFGGCWCMYFHPDEDHVGDNPNAKQRLVEQGRAHHALVMEGDAAVGWCEYGTPAELPRIYHRKEYDASGIEPTTYRLPCFFVDRNHRRQGVATLALSGALDLIAAAGGGSVEGYPRVDVGERKMSSSFLFSGSIGMFADAGFTRGPNLGKFRCIMRRTVAPA